MRHAVGAQKIGIAFANLQRMKAEQVAADGIEPGQFAGQHILAKIAFVPALHG
jgi:hypothetical protein